MRKILMFLLMIIVLLVGIDGIRAKTVVTSQDDDVFIKTNVKKLKVYQLDYNKSKICWAKFKNAKGYVIYSSSSKNGRYTKIGTTKSNCFVKGNLKLDSVYYYKVRAFKKKNNKTIYSKYSKSSGIRVKLVRPVAKISTYGKDGLIVSFKKVPYASYYQIYRANSRKGKYIKVATTKTNICIDKNLKRYHTYYYKIKAVKKVGNKIISSNYSKVSWETTGESNSKYKLNLKSVYGDTEAYHPDILFFENGWNGYKYWLVFTPYPRNDSSKENPHIKVSNDMKNWIVPKGTPNPLDVAKGDGLGKTLFNSDAELVYNNKLDRIECFWRRWEKDGETLYMKYTNDGHNWSNATKVYYASRITSNPNKLLSPTIVFEDGKYKMWYANNYTNWEIIYEEYNSLPFENPTGRRVFHMKTATGNLYPWHLDVIKNENKYEMLFIAVPKLQKLRNETVMSLYYSSSYDNITWTDSVKVLGPSKDPEAWDCRGIYRSSMFYHNGKYYIFYSGSNHSSVKGTSIIYGEKLNKLKPLFD